MRYVLLTLAFFLFPSLSFASTIEEIQNNIFIDAEGLTYGAYTNPIILSYPIPEVSGQYWRYVLDATSITPTMSNTCYAQDGTIHTETYTVDTLYGIDIYIYDSLSECEGGYPIGAINAVLFDKYTAPNTLAYTRSSTGYIDIVAFSNNFTESIQSNYYALWQYNDIYPQQEYGTIIEGTCTPIGTRLSFQLPENDYSIIFSYGYLTLEGCLLGDENDASITSGIDIEGDASNIIFTVGNQNKFYAMVAVGDTVSQTVTGESMGATVAYAGETFYKPFLGGGLALLYNLRYWIVAIIILYALAYFAYRASKTAKT